MRIKDFSTNQELHETYCPICGFEADELTVGAVLKYYGEDGELLGYGHPGGVFAHELIEHEVSYTTKALEESERAPAGEPCVYCAEDIANQREDFKEEVERGGIHWRCDNCGLWGVIKHNDSRGFSARARRKAGIQPPTHMGVRFSKCKQHRSEDDPAVDSLH